MSDIASTRINWLLRGIWAAGSAVCALGMYFYPQHGAIPFHLIWIGLCLVYGFTTWRPLEMVAMVAVTATVTGTIMVRNVSLGAIDWADTAEVPLSVALTAVIGVYLRRRHLAITELARLAEVERRRSEMREVLVRQVSHELLTPITIARGYTELVRKRISDPVVTEDTGIVLEELDKLAQITQRLVTLIQIDGRFDRRPVGLESELTRVVRRWMPAAARHWRVHAPTVDVPANRDRLETALDCLLDNAVKFTRRGDSIRVTGTVDDESWAVEVADSGPGMSTKDTASGTGLGLATVRTIAGAWGGTVRVRSEPGAGTTVTMRFPMAAVDEAK